MSPRKPATEPMDLDEPEQPENGVELEYVREVAAQLQDVKCSRARNGANFDVTFEVGMSELDPIGNAPDGLDVRFKDILVGEGAELRRLGVTRDADGNRHLKVAFHFSKSEIARSLGFLGDCLATDDEKGILLMESPKIPAFGTVRAE